jgi:hypothetical protein
MASVEKRRRGDGTTAHRVVWRDPCTREKQSLTFDDRREAERTRKLLDANGQRLVDAAAVAQAATGEPWQYYDLGHGYCAYTFFEQCPHRMACARCDFYTPKDSSKAQLLEATENLQKMLATIPLTDEERAAVDDGQGALDQLLQRLADVPTPAGGTPREIGAPPTATHLPIVDVRHDVPNGP